MKTKQLMAAMAVILALLFVVTTSCSKTENAPAPPVERKQPADIKILPPPSPPPQVTLTSGSQFSAPSIDYFGYIDDVKMVGQEQGGVYELEIPKSTHVGYVLLTRKEGEKFVPTKWLKIPPTSADAIDLDGTLESLDVTGWKFGDNVTVHAFKSEVDAASKKVKVTVGYELVDRTLADLDVSPYPWVVSHGEYLSAEIDEEVMLEGFKPEGIKLFAQFLRESDFGEESVSYYNDFEDESYILAALGNYESYAESFDELPDLAKGPIIDTMVPVALAKARTHKLSEEKIAAAAKRYLLDLTWPQIVAVDPNWEDDCSFWPEGVPDKKVVPYYGMSKEGCQAMLETMKMWQRRGQFSFERTKTAVARELKTPTAPAAKPTTTTQAAPSAPAAGGSRFRLAPKKP